MAESQWISRVNFYFLCFNPHHTGEWLKVVEFLIDLKGHDVSILIILANGWKFPEETELSYKWAVSILIILANGWKLHSLLTIAKMSVFQSSSYWRMAERTKVLGRRKLDPSFNPHHTGEWLKESKKYCRLSWNAVSILIILANGWKFASLLRLNCSKLFQSSSYWRMAESLVRGSFNVIVVKFQSSSYWRMAERLIW